MQRRHLPLRHSRIVDQFLLLLARDRITHRSVETREFCDRLDIDVDRIEKQAAVWCIGTAVGGLIVKQRVQRIQADAGASEPRCETEQMLQVGEIADPPVALRAQAVELHREHPDPVELTLKGCRRNDKHGPGRAHRVVVAKYIKPIEIGRQGFGKLRAAVGQVPLACEAIARKQPPSRAGIGIRYRNKERT